MINQLPKGNTTMN